MNQVGFQPKLRLTAQTESWNISHMLPPEARVRCTPIFGKHDKQKPVVQTGEKKSIFNYWHPDWVNTGPVSKADAGCNTKYAGG